MTLEERIKLSTNVEAAFDRLPAYSEIKHKKLSRFTGVDWLELITLISEVINAKNK